MMEGIGSEVSHKIRAAIKAKLIELGAYIDDELPDYIMVMVANKRSRQQMDEDLQLFLGANTKTFTSWLHTVLQKLQEVTVATFDVKKDSQGKRCSKRKRSTSDENARKGSKSSDEKAKVVKKHSKKHKEGKKLKKSKHKNKDKDKSKEKKVKCEASGNGKEKKGDKGVEKDASDSSHVVTISSSNVGNVEKKKSEAIEFDDSRPKASNSPRSQQPFVGSGKNDKFKSFESDDDDDDRTSTKSSCSPSQFSEDGLRGKSRGDRGESKNVDRIEFAARTRGVIEDEFNIEPLGPNESGDQFASEKEVVRASREKSQDSRSEQQGVAGARQVASGAATTGTTVKAPTRELLKEHDKILSETEENASKAAKKSDDGSEESLSPEEIRKQLLLSRAKKKLEQSKLADRMKSNSPDIEVLESNNSTARPEEGGYSSLRRSSQRRDYDEDEHTGAASSAYDNGSGMKLSSLGADAPTASRGNCDKENGSGAREEHRKYVISISKSLEMEKNLGLKCDDRKRSKTKSSSSVKKKPVPSRIVTIPEPEAPEIPSIVKVKPREFVSKDKQANKALILKAVADAEKSIATVHSRNDGDMEMKKTEALFTKNLRGKRYEKLAVTLSNVQGGVVDRDKTKRMVSVDSENTNALDRKTESLQDSEMSQGLRSRPELTLKNISNKSEDQFISSKTSAMEKNDKYIHYWLEGVEQAVKDDEIVNPSEMDDFVRGRFSDEGKDDENDSVKDGDRKKKKRSWSDEDATKARRSGEKNASNSKLNNDDGPQIVVTLDGLTSKAIKDIILRNRDTPNGPLLASGASRKGGERDGKDGREAKASEDFDKNSKFAYKSGEAGENATTSRVADAGEKQDKGGGFEKISERFGRINKTSEIHEYKEKYYEFERERYEKKYLKYQGTDKEKHYEKLKDKYASAGESKNKKLIAKLSEKFGKVDREFENKKRKYSDDDARYSYSSSNRRVERPMDRSDAKYRKLDRKSLRSTSDDSRRMRSKERCMFWPKCFRGKYCEYQHPS